MGIYLTRCVTTPRKAAARHTAKKTKTKRGIALLPALCDWRLRKTPARRREAIAVRVGYFTLTPEDAQAWLRRDVTMPKKSRDLLLSGISRQWPWRWHGAINIRAGLA